jgi:hypothetical protein
MRIASDENTRVWLYSGFFSGWWCYDEKNNNKLNMIYMDYCTRNGIITNITKNTSPTKNKSVRLSVFDVVDFHTTEDVNNGAYNIDYVINTTHGDFKIDFRNMKQINLQNFKKQQSLDFIMVPTKVYNNMSAFIKYLKKINIIGISGKKFD